MVVQTASGQAFSDQATQTIGTTYTYTSDNKIQTTTHPNGTVEINYYDERRYLIAKVGVVRTQKPSGIQIRPITYFRVNAHGERVGVFIPDGGCALAVDPNVLPTPLNPPSSRDQHTRFFRDAKGHILVHQDTDNNLKQITYTETGKISRRYKPTTVSNSNKPGDITTHIDETQKEYDALDRETLSTVLRDGVIQDKVATQYDAFTKIAQGPGDGTYPEQFQHDQAARVWMAPNDKKERAKLIGHDAAGNETVGIESLQMDLSAVPYENLPAIMQDRNSLTNEFTETIRDAGSRPVGLVEPSYSENAQTVRPLHQVAWTAFDKKASVTTPANATTNYTHNKFNKLSKQVDPAIPVLDESNNISTVTPKTEFGFNVLGGKIGIKDENNNTQIIERDEANQKTSHVAADGVTYGIETRDVFGNAVAVTDASGNVWKKVFNGKNKVVQVILPSGDTWNYTLNENDFVIKITPPEGSAAGATQYAQGPFGDMSAEFLPEGEAHHYSHDRHHGVLCHKAVNKDGSLAYTVLTPRDFFGKIISKTNGEGSTFSYLYFPNGMLKQLLQLTAGFAGKMLVFDSTINQFTTNTIPTPLQNVTYGYLTSLRPTSITTPQQQLSRTFDIERNILSTTETNAAGRLLRQTVMTYLAMHLPATQTDLGGFSLNTFYTPTLDRRRLQASCGSYALDAYWLYDIARRVLVNGGKFINGKIQSVYIEGGWPYLYPTQGNTFAYQNGELAAQLLYFADYAGGQGNSPLSVTFARDVNGRIATLSTTPYSSSMSDLVLPRQFARSRLRNFDD